MVLYNVWYGHDVWCSIGIMYGIVWYSIVCYFVTFSPLFFPFLYFSPLFSQFSLLLTLPTGHWPHPRRHHRPQENPLFLYSHFPWLWLCRIPTLFRRRPRRQIPPINGPRWPLSYIKTVTTRNCAGKRSKKGRKRKGKRGKERDEIDYKKCSV